MRDEMFIRDKVPMTKEEIRVLSLERLALTNAKHLLDIGGGTGSVSIEAAIRNSNMKVTVVERNELAIDLINKNSQKFKVQDRLQIIEGYAPIKEFKEKVDRVFIGGSGNNLEEIFEWIYELLEEEGILVMNCITLETLTRALEYLNMTDKFDDIDGMMVNIGRLEPLGRSTYFKPLNPTYIISAKKK